MATADDEQVDVRMSVLHATSPRTGWVGWKASDARATLRDEPVDEIDRGRRDDRVEPRLRDLDERVRLLDTRRVDPARSPENRRAKSAHHVVREKRAGERVALEPLVLHAIEREPQRFGTIDPRATFVEPPAHAGSSPT